MQIRSDNPEMKRYEITNTGIDMDVVERKLKNKQTDRYDRNNKNNQVNDYRRGQKAY
jgi:hypothetical protein